MEDGATKDDSVDCFGGIFFYLNFIARSRNKTECQREVITRWESAECREVICSLYAERRDAF